MSYTSIDVSDSYVLSRSLWHYY